MKGLLIVFLLLFELSLNTCFQKQVKIGEQINLTGCTYKVKQFKFKKYVGLLGATVKANGKGTFLITTIEVKNTTKAPFLIDNSDITLSDAQGNSFAYSPEATAAIEVYGSKTFFLSEINPGLTVTAKVVFEVPDTDRQFKLRLTSVTGKDFANVILDKPVKF
jgi:hypothetical protein